MVRQLREGVKAFQKDVYPKNQALFRRLAKAQTPSTLMVTCADSRVDPNLITQHAPGEIFVCRNAGNIIPPYGAATDGTIASIDYAVRILGVKDIIVCGHTDCGAMKGLMHNESLSEFPEVLAWLQYARAAHDVVRETTAKSCDTSYLRALTEENVRTQMFHLITIPSIAARYVKNAISIHGWVYEIETGEVHEVDPGVKFPLSKRTG